MGTGNVHLWWQLVSLVGLMIARAWGIQRRLRSSLFHVVTMAIVLHNMGRGCKLARSKMPQNKWTILMMSSTMVGLGTPYSSHLHRSYSPPGPMTLPSLRAKRLSIAL